MLAHSFLIESSSKLLVTRTGIKAQTSSISGRKRLLTLELLALEWQKFYTFWTWISLRPVGQCWSNFMCSITGDGERLHNILRQIGSKLWCLWQQKAPIDPLMGKMVSPPFFRLLLIQSFLYLQVTRTYIKSWTSSNFTQIRPLTTELAALERLKKFPIDL